jgi:hypothetical protein
MTGKLKKCFSVISQTQQVFNIEKFNPPKNNEVIQDHQAKIFNRFAVLDNLEQGSPIVCWHTPRCL